MITKQETKTERIQSWATITVADTACCPRMAWESPRIVFDTGDGRTFVWHSDNIHAILAKRGMKHSRDMQGKTYCVELIVRGNRVWRLLHIYEEA